jgi:cephalosporin-C deacetylase
MNYIDMPLDELRVYKPAQTKELDFEMFWERTKRESKGQPLNAEVIAVNYPVEQVNIFEVYYDGYKNSRIHGRLILPRDASKINKVPAMICYHGYNYNNQVYSNAFKYSLLGYAVFLAEVRGQNVKSPDQNCYDNGGACGWMTLGINNPENYYFRYVFMDSVRAVDYMLQREDIDTSRIAVEGGSQGGGLSLAVGALAPEVKVVMADIPFLCHYRRAVRMALESPYMEIAHFFRIFDSLHKTEDEIYSTLSYFDNLNLASYIKADTMVSIGLEDTICPPSTSFAAFNHIDAIKELRVYPDFPHGGFNQQEEEKLFFIKEHFDR